MAWFSIPVLMIPVAVGILPLNGSIRRVYLPPELGDFFETFGEWRKGVRDIWDIGGYKRN
jgi:hypothetical protein